MFELIVISVLLASIWYLLQTAIYLCAKLSCFWVILEEGYSAAIMRSGIFYKMILSYTGYHFIKSSSTNDSNDNLDIYEIGILPSENSSRASASWIYSILFPIRGVVWVGIPGMHSIHLQVNSSSEKRFTLPDNKPGRILVQRRLYELTMKDIELAGGIPYEIQLLVSWQVTNPAKALFRVEDYFNTSMERIYSWARKEFSTLSYNDFVSRITAQQDDTPAQGASGKLEQALSRILDLTHDLKRHFGVTVIEIHVVDINPSNEDMRAVTIKREVAAQDAAAAVEAARGQADAAVTLAKGKALVTEIEANARAASMRIVNDAAQEMGGNAMRLSELQTMEKATLTLIGKDLSLPTVLPLPSSSEEKKERS